MRLSLRTAVGSLRARLFARPTVTGNPLMAAGEGATDRFGNIVYSTAGTLTEQQLALSHETVHSILSPRLLALRSVRADIGMWAYRRTALMRYLEEALAESYAPPRSNGLTSSKPLLVRPGPCRRAAAIEPSRRRRDDTLRGRRSGAWAF